MPDDLLPRTEEIFQEAADLPREAREAFLERECGNDRALEGAVRELLAALDGMADLLPASPRSFTPGSVRSSSSCGSSRNRPTRPEWCAHRPAGDPLPRAQKHEFDH